jgi:hypothetical protein
MPPATPSRHGPPKVRRRPDQGRRAANKSGNGNRPVFSKPTPAPLQALLEDLALIADERDRLLSEIAWLRLRFELACDVSAEEISAVSARVEDFKRVCRAMKMEPWA